MQRRHKGLKLFSSGFNLLQVWQFFGCQATKFFAPLLLYSGMTNAKAGVGMRVKRSDF